MAVATALNPLNTSMIAVALADVRSDLRVGPASASLLLLSFALASAVAQPLAGWLADRVGSRRVLVAGLAIAGATGVAAAAVPSFAPLVAVRAIQALGTSVGFPAGVAALGALVAGGGRGGRVPAAWLGALTVSSNASAALGPVLGSFLGAVAGWRAVFLVNVPISLVAIGLALAYLPPDAAGSPRPVATDRGAAGGRALWSVYARFALVCAIFYSVFFALPQWLESTRRLTAPQTGLVMLPFVGTAVLAMPFAVRLLSRVGVARMLVVGAGGLVVATWLLTLVGADTSVVALVAIAAALGVPSAFNNLGLQAELVEHAPRERQGAAAGWFQNARFVGAMAAAGLLAMVGDPAATRGLRTLAVVLALSSVALLVWSGRRAVALAARKPVTITERT